MVSKTPGLDESKDLHRRMTYVIESYDRAQLFHLLVQLQKKADNFERLRQKVKDLEKEVGEKERQYQAAIKHWKIFQEHLDKNPSLKEEWDNLCMAIKLTEEID